MKIKQELADIFSIFHDGVIEGYRIEKDDLYLKVSCTYLAVRIKPSFEFFYLQLINLDRIELNSYNYITDHSNTEDYPTILYNTETIFEEDIDIYNAIFKDEFVKVNIWVINEKAKFVANQLNIKCETYKLYDEINQPLPLSQLYKISEDYWKEFKEKKN